MAAVIEECTKISDEPVMAYDENSIENLLLKAKHFQNRNSIRDSDVQSTREVNSPWKTELPPVWDSNMIQYYVQGIVGEYLNENTVLIPKNNAVTACDERVQEVVENKTVNDVTECCQVDNVKPTSVEEEIQIKWVPVKKPEIPPILEKKLSLPIKPATNRTCEIRKNYILENNINQNSVRISSFNSKTNKTPRIQYSLYSGNAKGLNTINFAEVHPELGLDSNNESGTLFPRRYAIKTDENPLNVYESGEQKTDLPNPVAILDDNKIELANDNIIDKTWHEELSTQKPKTKTKKQKKSRNKPKMLHIKVPEVDGSLTELQQPTTVSQPIQLKITSPILNMAQNQQTQELPKLENNEINGKSVGSEQKSKEQTKIIYDKPFVHNMPSINDIKNKFSIQNFPVLCIRGEFKIQKVASISIEGDNNALKANKTGGGPVNRRNVQYVEYVYKDKKLEDVLFESQPLVLPDQLDDSKGLKTNLDRLKGSELKENSASINTIPKTNKFFQPFNDMTNLALDNASLSKCKLMSTKCSSNSEMPSSPINLTSSSEPSYDSSSTLNSDNNLEKLVAKRIVWKRKPSNEFVSRYSTIKKKDKIFMKSINHSYFQRQVQSSTTTLLAGSDEYASWFKQSNKKAKCLKNVKEAKNILEHESTVSEESHEKHTQRSSPIEQLKENDVYCNSPFVSHAPKRKEKNKNNRTKYLDNIFQQIENGKLEGLRMFKERHNHEISYKNLDKPHNRSEISDIQVLAPYLPYKAQHCFDIDEYSKFLYNGQITEISEKPQSVKKSSKNHNNYAFETNCDSTRTSETNLNSIEAINQLNEISSAHSHGLRKNESELALRTFQEYDVENLSNYERTLNSIRSERNKFFQETLSPKRKTSFDPEVQRAVNKFLKCLYNSNSKVDDSHGTYLLSKNDNTINQTLNDAELSSAHAKRKRKEFLTSELSSSSSTTFKQIAKSNKKQTPSVKFYNYLEQNCKIEKIKSTDFDLKQTLIHPTTTEYDNNILSSSFSSISLNLDLSQLNDTASSTSLKELTSWKQLAKASKAAVVSNSNKRVNKNKDESCYFPKVFSNEMSEGEVLSLGEV